MYMGFAFWRIYYNIYLEDLGFKGAQIGTLNAILQATIFFVVTFWGMIADKKGIRPALRIVAFATAISVFFLKDINSFSWLILYIPLLTVFYHPIGPLTDAMATEYSQEFKQHSFGGFRLWGSLGWAIASIIGGVLFMHIPLNFIFPLSSAMFLLSLIFLSTRKKRKTFRPNFQGVNTNELIKNKSLLLFSVLMIFYGVVYSPINSYLNLYFTELNAGNNIVGYAYAIMAASEIPLFLLGTKLLKRFGANRLILYAICVMLIRLLIYGFFPKPIIGLITGGLQGITLSFFLVGAVDYLQQLLPERHATAQSLIWGLYVGLGQTAGNLFIGGLIDNTGMVGVMKISAILAFICLIYAWWYFSKLISN